jgi:hypothetical protein
MRCLTPGSRDERASQTTLGRRPLGTTRGRPRQRRARACFPRRSERVRPGMGELPSTTGSHPTRRPCIRRCGPRGTPKRPASRRNSTDVRPRNSTRPSRSSSPRPPPTATAPRAGSTRASSRPFTGRLERAHAARHDRGHRGADRPRVAPHGEGRRHTSISANTTTTMRPRRSCATAPERRRARGGVGDDGRCVRGACGTRGRMDFSRPLRQALW